MQHRVGEVLEGGGQKSPEAGEDVATPGLLWRSPDQERSDPDSELNSDLESANGEVLA